MRTKPIATEINGEKVHVVYIEYHDGKPHSVITLDKYGRENWDFDFNNNWGEYMHYNSGGGGDIKNIYGPHFVEGTKGASIWFAKGVTFKKNHPPKNCRILKNPIRLKKDGKTMIDPFKFSYQEVAGIMYCKFCEGYYDESGCQQHMDLWEDKYHDGSPISD